MTTKPRALSSFAAAALALDAEFGDFERLAGELDRLNLDSERGLERAAAVLAELGVCRERIGPASHELGRALEEARDKVGTAAALVSDREAAVHERQHVTESMLSRYKALSEMVAQISAAVAKLKTPEGELGSTEQRDSFKVHLPEINNKMGFLVDQAKKLMDDARSVNLKVLERNADSLRQSLQAARHRCNILAQDLNLQ